MTCWPNGEHTSNATPPPPLTHVRVALASEILAQPWSHCVLPRCMRARVCVNPTRDKTGRLDELLHQAAGSSGRGRGWFGL